MTHLVRRFVCGRCGATAPLSDRPYQECASCRAVSDFDFGVARQHRDWPKHEAQLAQLFDRYGQELQTAAGSHDRDGYAAAYTAILRQLIHRLPALYPSRAVEPAYADQLAAFHGMWQAVTAIEPALVRGDLAFRARREEVKTKGNRVQPETLWPLIDHAVKHIAEVQRIADLMTAPPDDFVPGFIQRFSISVTVAEWLPQLPLDAQQELVTRMGVANEYVAPGEGHRQVSQSAAGRSRWRRASSRWRARTARPRSRKHHGFRAIEAERYEGSGYDRRVRLGRAVRQPARPAASRPRRSGVPQGQAVPDDHAARRVCGSRRQLLADVRRAEQQEARGRARVDRAIRRAQKAPARSDPVPRARQVHHVAAVGRGAGAATRRDRQRCDAVHGDRWSRHGRRGARRWNGSTARVRRGRQAHEDDSARGSGGLESRFS